MPDLIAQATHSRHRWRRTFPDSPVRLGRSGDGAWAVPWDDHISRDHATLRLDAAGSLIVEKIPTARNPIFYRGQKHDSFTVAAGEHFVIGNTTFTLAVRPEVNVSDANIGVTEHVYEAAELRRHRFRDAASRIEALSRLPDIIGGSNSVDELLFRVVSLLMSSIHSASAVAILQVKDGAPPTILHYDNRLPEANSPRPSARIVLAAAKRKETVLHLWSGGDPGSRGDAYTASEEVDWAFGVPIGGDGGDGWVIYIAGQLESMHGGNVGMSIQAAPEDLQDDAKFTELVGTMVANLRHSRALQKRQLGMRRFFAPVVMDAMASRDPDIVLQPREADVSVLFCDLRGFTQQSEQARGQLLDLLHRVSDALGVMTGEILRAGGVVGDFHGDAAMGFWGWPLDQPDACGRAAAAALAIRNAFRQGTMHGFRCGIGVATGRAVAGRIGTVDQVKVTAFGPVVNLASRLEGMTKSLGVEILLDEASANWVRKQVPGDQMRVRKLAAVRPAGLLAGVTVSQLLPPASDRNSPTDGDLTAYEEALDAFNGGDWERAFECLHRVSADDRGKDFLTSIILRHGRMAPPDWNGIVDIPK